MGFVTGAIPVGVDRETAVDYAADKVWVRDRFTYEHRPDDWKTGLRCLAPASPVFALGGLYGNIDLRIGSPLKDFSLTTLHGPYLAALDADRLVYSVSGLLRFPREAREVVPPESESIAYQKAKRALNMEVERLLTSDALDVHPWKWTSYANGLVPGSAQVNFSYLLLSVPYLDEPLKERVSRVIKDEIETVFLQKSGSAGESAPYLVKIRDPLLQRSYLIEPSRVKARGTDAMFFGALRLYSIWQTAHYLEAWDLVEGRWDFIRTIHSLLLHSHDWSTLQSWDYFSGYRIGNGLQESGGLYAGYSAIARMADRLGDEKTRDQAAALAVLHLVALDVANTGIDYYRIFRPWTTVMANSVNIGKGERLFPKRYIEFNEYIGSSANVIGLPYNLMSRASYLHYPIADIMRPYAGVWPKENAAFFAGMTYDPELEEALYMVGASREQLDAIYHRQSKYYSPVKRVMAERSYLDSYGIIRWSDVFTSKSND